MCICLSVCLLKCLALTRCKVALKYANKWEVSNYVLVRTPKVWLSVLFVNMITCPLVNLSFFCNFHFFYLPLYGSAFLLNYMKEEKNIARIDRAMKNFKLDNKKCYYTDKSVITAVWQARSLKFEGIILPEYQHYYFQSWSGNGMLQGFWVAWCE